MTREQPLILDAASDESISKFGLSAPVIASQKGFWNGVKASYYQFHTAIETPDHCFGHHYITIHLNHPATLKEHSLNGHLRCDRFRNRDICLTPATAPVLVRLHDYSELICLQLEPTFMRQIAAELVDPDRIEVVPYFKLNDPLIYQIGIALKANLESESIGSRLYTESMATGSIPMVRIVQMIRPKTD